MGESMHQLGVAIRSAKQALLDFDNISDDLSISTSSYSSTSIDKKLVEDPNSISSPLRIASNSITNNSSSSMSLSLETNQFWMSGNNLNDTTIKRRYVFVQEMNSILEMLVAIEAGADLIGTKYPLILTSSGLVLHINWNDDMEKYMEKVYKGGR